MHQSEVSEKKLSEDLNAVVAQQNTIRTKMATFENELKDKVGLKAFESRSSKQHEHKNFNEKIEEVEKKLELLTDTVSTIDKTVETLEDGNESQKLSAKTAMISTTAQINTILFTE